MLLFSSVSEKFEQLSTVRADFADFVVISLPEKVFYAFTLEYVKDKNRNGQASVFLLGVLRSENSNFSGGGALIPMHHWTIQYPYKKREGCRRKRPV